MDVTNLVAPIVEPKRENMKYHSDGGISLPNSPVTDRQIPVSSKGNFIGSFVWDDGAAGVVTRTESHTEMKWGIILATDPNIKSIEEQVAFDWYDADGVIHTHYFDFVCEMTSGKWIAFPVKPEAKLESGGFAKDIGQISYQAKAEGFVDEVRLLSDVDINPIRLFNAKMLYGSRLEDEPADGAALKAVSDLTGAVELATLTEETGMGARGYRALQRLLRIGVLIQSRHEKISPMALVSKAVMQ